MKKTMKLLPALFFIMLLAACSKKESVVPAEDSTADAKKEKGVILSGEIDAGTIARSVVVGPGPGFDYLWSNTNTPKTQDIYLYFKQDPTKGNKQGFIKTPLTIDPVKGSGSFSITLAIMGSSGIGSWFIPGQDFVAGAIDVDPANPPTTANPNLWGFKTPAAIDASKQTYLPMFFPLTKSTWLSGNSPTTYKGTVFGTFQTFGSVLAFEVTNPTLKDYAPTNLYLTSETFRTKGTTSANVQPGNYPSWTSAPAIGDTTTSINISNFVVPANGGKKTLYVWVAQNGTVRKTMFARFATNKNPAVNDVADRIATLRPPRTDASLPNGGLLVNNAFYTIKMTVTSDLMITELLGSHSYVALGTSGAPNPGSGGAIELYNGSNVAVDLSNYYVEASQTSGPDIYWQRLSTTSLILQPGKFAILVFLPAAGSETNTDWTSLDTKLNSITGGTTGNVRINLDPLAGDNWNELFWRGREVRLAKYSPDFNYVIDMVSGWGPVGGSWGSGYYDARKITDAVYPTPFNNFAQWKTDNPSVYRVDQLGVR